MQETAPNFDPLRIGVSTRALFALEEEHAIFRRDGVDAYAKHQLEKEQEVLGKGVAFEVIQRLLALNETDMPTKVEVIFLSRNSPDLSLRAFHSCEKFGLKIERGSFTSGNSVAPFVRAWGMDLFLSNEQRDVDDAIRGGTAAALLGSGPTALLAGPDNEVRIAFDGDAVVFDAASDRIASEVGLPEFYEHERTNATIPMESGPFAGFLRKLSRLRLEHMRADGSSRVRIAIVTARNAPAHARVVHTLRNWGTPADEAHFVGKASKTPFLAAFGAHIFFDDRKEHVSGAASVVPAGLVPTFPPV